MPKSFLVKNTSRNKRKLEEEICEGEYLSCIAIDSTADNLVKGQLATYPASFKILKYNMDKTCIAVAYFYLQICSILFDLLNIIKGNEFSVLG